MARPTGSTSKDRINQQNTINAGQKLFSDVNYPGILCFRSLALNLQETIVQPSEQKLFYSLNGNTPLSGCITEDWSYHLVSRKLSESMVGTDQFFRRSLEALLPVKDGRLQCTSTSFIAAFPVNPLKWSISCLFYKKQERNQDNGIINQL